MYNKILSLFKGMKLLQKWDRQWLCNCSCIIRVIRTLHMRFIGIMNILVVRKVFILKKIVRKIFKWNTYHFLLGKYWQRSSFIILIWKKFFVSWKWLHNSIKKSYKVQKFSLCNHTFLYYRSKIPHLKIVLYKDHLYPNAWNWKMMINLSL